MKTVLIIDDHDEFREIAVQTLMCEDYDVLEASSVHDAFKILEGEKVDLILCDLNLPFKNGPEQGEFEYSCKTGIWTIRELRDVYPDLPIAALTSLGEVDLARIRCQLEGAIAFTKPSRTEELSNIVSAVLSRPDEPVLH